MSDQEQESPRVLFVGYGIKDSSGPWGGGIPRGAESLGGGARAVRWSSRGLRQAQERATFSGPGLEEEEGLSISPHFGASSLASSPWTN